MRCLGAELKGCPGKDKDKLSSQVCGPVPITVISALILKPYHRRCVCTWVWICKIKCAEVIHFKPPVDGDVLKWGRQITDFNLVMDWWPASCLVTAGAVPHNPATNGQQKRMNIDNLSSQMSKLLLRLTRMSILQVCSGGQTSFKNMLFFFFTCFF